MSIFQNRRVTRLCDAIARVSPSEILSVVKLSNDGNKTDATFCFTDTCKDCGCNNDCKCDIECRKDDSCSLTHICTPTCGMTSDCGNEGY